MKKIKATRSDIICITTQKYKLADNPKGKINYEKWVEFIDNHKDYFVWYENTEDGIYRKNNMGKIPNWAQERFLSLLDKKSVYLKTEIEKNNINTNIVYSSTNSILRINVEKKMTKEVAKILLEMADFLSGKIIINGNKELQSIEQLE